MARPAKSISAKTGQISKEEKQKREAVENSLKGGEVDLTPPRHLSAAQKKIYRFILEQLEESKLLGQLDVFILSRTAITIDRLNVMDKKAKKEPDIIYNNNFRLAQGQATQEFFRCCNELCLSPQARAKLSVAAAKASEPQKKTLMDILAEDDDD